MKKALLIIAELALSLIVLAVITDRIAGIIEMPFWLAIVIGLGAFMALAAVTYLSRQQPEQPTAEDSPNVQAPQRLRRLDQLQEPGDLPAGSRVPFTHNALFTGRVEPLLSLARALLYDAADAGAAATVVTQIVQGMGGIGKTQLAVEFAYRYGRFFQGIHWIAAAQPDLIGAEIAECGRSMGLSPWPEEQPEQIGRTLLAWREAEPRLIILDNLEDVDAARQWLPRLHGNGIRLMLTARRSDWPADLGLDSLPLDLFSPTESLAFLRRTLPADRASDVELAALAKRLGHLPLALELAARYLERHPRLSVPGYLERLDDVFADAAMAGWRADLGNPTGHDLDLAATFRLSWDQIGDEGAQRLFLAAGQCAPNQPIPCELLEKAAGLDQDGCGAALSILTGLGLLEMDDPAAGPTIHALLAEYACTLPGASEALSALTGALNSLSYDALDTGLPAAFLPLRPHVEEAARAAEAASLDIGGILWGNLGCHLDAVADYAGARAAHERALGIDEAAYGPDHPSVGRDVNNLGSVLKATGDLVGAHAAFERALVIGEAAYGPEHPSVAGYVNNLGGVLRDLGDYAGARAAFERALAIDEAVYGPDHVDVARDVNNLAGVLLLGSLPGARAALERVLEILTRMLPEDHPHLATAHNNLGGALQAEGDLAGARLAFERALAIDESVYGPDHPDVAKGLNNLGVLLQDLGDLAGAQATLERALAIDEAAYGPDHPDVARDVNNLGLVLRELGDLPGARAAFERVLAILAKTLPQNHPHIAITHDNLGGVLLDHGDLAGAHAAYERALSIDEAVYGPDHPAVALRVNNLGSVLQALGDLDGARAAYERALAIGEAVYGPDHPTVAPAHNNLGTMLQDLGDLEGARAAYERALSIFEAFGDPRAAIIRRNLAALDD